MRHKQQQPTSTECSFRKAVKTKAPKTFLLANASRPEEARCARLGSTLRVLGKAPQPLVTLGGGLDRSGDRKPTVVYRP